ncbi:hypothetical protein SEUCBS140593_007749 [Sporothrix eucalyptigena]|uniref:Rhodopsin domain-containing protein n=1 Tax=Sporothrix eucalyptigena TaxID=1812306 RepID=A0ABP0CH08_9PEZI
MATEDYSSALLVSSALMICLTTMAIIMRLSVRLGVLGGLGWDDTLVGAGWVFALVLYSTTIAARQYGFGIHLDNIPTNDQSAASKLILVCSVAYSLSCPTVKAAFCILYLRILRGRTLELLNKGLIVFFAAQSIEECFVTIFQCHPVQKAWFPSVEGTCFSLVPLFWCTFVFNLVTELILFLQPIPTIWHLQVPVAKRIGVIVMLSLGLLVCVISIIRMVYVTKIGSDTTYDYSLTMIWSQVEVSALILCSCIPYSRQVVQRVPWLSHLLGFHLHPHGGKDAADNPGLYNMSKGGQHPLGIALQKRIHNPGAGDIALPSRVDSTDEIFPYRPNNELDQGDKNLVAMAAAVGAIVVTHDITYEYEYDSRNEVEESPGARTIVYTGRSSDSEDEDNKVADDESHGDGESTAHGSEGSAEFAHKYKVTEDA